MQSEELTQPRWNAIANEMLPKFKHIGEYPEACQKLQQINALCEKAGGSLVSRQHDDECSGLFMIPLIVDWHIKRTCQIKGCSERTNAIVCFRADESPIHKPLHIGICEKHHKEAKEKDKFHYTVDL